jgi:pimeloyl-ACP methyl ester carboxylesterase
MVIMAHGSCSNRFSQGLFKQLATKLSKQGCNVLAFDFSGHGESDDDVISLEKAASDVEAAIAFVKQKGFSRLVLLGHSLGAYACLQAFCPEVETILLLGGLTGPVVWKWEDMCSLEQLKEAREKGYITNYIRDGLRESVRVDAGLLSEILAINQVLMLKPITCPVFIIHGDADQQELDLLALSKKALPLLPTQSKLQVIHGASHAFTAHMDEVYHLVYDWLKIYCRLA